MQKINDKLNTIEEKVETIMTDNKSYRERLTNVEKTLFAVKWGLVGGAFILIATQGSTWIPLILKLLTKGSV